MSFWLNPAAQTYDASSPVVVPAHVTSKPSSAQNVASFKSAHAETRETALGFETDADTDIDQNFGSSTRARRIPAAALLLTLNQISVMVGNGIDIAESLYVASKYCRNKPLAQLLARCHLAVTQGVRLSVALAQEPAFPSHLTAMFTAAEASGSMPAALRRAVEMLRNQQQLRSTIVSALIYPTILASASAVVLCALVFFVLPQFSHVFKTMGKPMPASTAILLACGQFARSHWYWFVGGAAVLIGLVVGCKNQPFVAQRIAWFSLYGPVFRNAYRPLTTGRMFSSLGSMLAGGVPLLDAVRLTKAVLGNHYFKGLMTEIESELIVGNPLSSPIAAASFLPPEAIQMAAAAERTGRLAEVFSDLGAYYEEEGSRQLKKLVHLIEPMVIIVMGGMVAGVVLSIMLPLLDISSAT